jgi:protein phosphatase
VSAPTLPIHTASLTDAGLKRTNNEDSHAVWTPPGSTDPVVAVVCDGVGGANAGEMASHLAVEVVLRMIGTHLDGDPGAVLRLAIETANREVYAAAQERAELRGMGTTCTVLAFHAGRAHVAHVGDSRVYHLRDGRLRQLTEDHSLVAQLVAREQITPEEAKRDARRNIVTRAVGILPEVQVDVLAPVVLESGDTFLLCSDGLHGPVAEADLARLAAEPSLEEACRELVGLANGRGGPDNITVVLARAGGPPRATRAGTPGPLLLLGVLALVGLAGVAWLLLSGIAR